jgi:transcriptional adapter 3
MPPQAGQKGTGKKGGRGTDARRSRSRNTTPAITTHETDTAYLQIVIKPLYGASYDEIVDPQISLAIPDSKALQGVMERIDKLIEQIDARDQVASKAIRLAVQKKKERNQELEAETLEEMRLKLQREAAVAEEESQARKANKLKKKNEGNKAERPLTHGAHGLAPQDGSNIGTWVDAEVTFPCDTRSSTLSNKIVYCKVAGYRAQKEPIYILLVKSMSS